MIYKTILPPPSLASYIRYYWYMESNVSQNNPFIYRDMADSCPGLIFHYKATFEDITTNKVFKFPKAILHGQTKEMKRFSTNQNFGIFGVYLYPYAIQTLCKMPAMELSDQMPHLATVLGQQGKDLEEKMMLASSNVERTTIMNSFLLKKMSSSSTSANSLSQAVSFLISTKGNISMKNLAEKFSFSSRQLERKFKEYAGFNPKLYARIVRFQAATEKYGEKNLSLTELAYDCGYYDQSHFIHEFKKFSGYHPKTYFKGKAEGIAFKEV